MVRVSSKIRRLLVDEGLVTTEQWETVSGQGRDALDTLLSQGVVEEASLMEVLGRAAGMPPLDLTTLKPDPLAVQCVAEAMCKERQILPLTKNGNVLTIAVSDPFDVILLDDLKRMTRCHVRTVFAHASMVRAALDAQFDAGARQVSDLMDEVSGKEDLHIEEDREDAQDIESVAVGDDAPAVKLANLIILRALKEKASDIHVEPMDGSIRVRFRIDGRMRIAMTPPKSLLPALTSRLKILAKLDIAERNKPQDGKFQIRFEGRSIDFRLSILPVVGGEKAVIRILDTGSIGLKLDSMGYETKCFEDISKAINQPYGMVLVTGPTGSGKSTTLYSCVQEIATPEVNVTTVEDPVEYRMDGINQVPVNPKRGMTFAGALRSILRQDPDIVLVGEIRDTETADIAIKAALTGHLVMSTLHTNDAASTLTRLVDMGIDPFMVSSSLLCICAQRLGRRLCKQCREPVENPPKAPLLEVGFLESDLQNLEIYQPKPDGCSRCNRGYRGRFAVLETMAISQKIRRMIVEGASVELVKAQAVSEGMLTLRRVGILNVIRGVTSLEEILRITLDD